MSTWRERRAARKEAKRRECRVSEEWCGYFIGRKYCSTHDEKWDWPIKRCPCFGEEPAQ